METKVLDIRNLSTWFDTRRGYLKAVDDISFHVLERETLCIVGESGSGKSVTARSILRILPKTGMIKSGSILYRPPHDRDAEVPDYIDLAKVSKNGKEISQIRINELSMIFQEPMSALSPVHRCGDQVSEAILLKWQGVSKKEAAEMTLDLLDKVKIHNPAEVAKQYPFELSGGMRQRICIALAISCRPSILIADEPTTALDVTTQREILRLIKQLQDDMGMTVIFITHDMGVVSQIADRMVVMQKGKIVEEADTVSIFEHPNHEYTRRLIESTLVLESRSIGKRPAEEIITEESEPVVQIKNLTKVFESKSGGLFSKERYVVRAVDDVSFDVYPGETIGIAGESGSGKTTLGRCLVGLYSVTSGKIRYKEEGGSLVDLHSHTYVKSDPFFRQIRMIFQDPYSSLNPRMTIFNIIAEPMRLHGIPQEEWEDRVAELLRMVELSPEMMERYPHAFSGGQRQRISIAACISLNPRIVIADEATAALDVSLRARLLDLLIDLQERMNFSVILITHDISTVRYFGDRVVIMENGKLVEQGPVSDVLDSPKEEYTQQLISAVPRPNPRRRVLLA